MNAPVMAIYSIDDLSISMFLKKTTLFNVFFCCKNYTFQIISPKSAVEKSKENAWIESK